MSRLTTTGSRAIGMCPTPCERDVLGTGQLGEREAALERLAVVAVALDDQHRAAHAPAGRLDVLRASACSTRPSPASRPAPSRPYATASSTALVECGSGNISPKKNSRNAALVGEDRSARFSFSQPCGSLAHLVPKVSGAAARQGCGGVEQRDARGDRDDAEHPLAGAPRRSGPTATRRRCRCRRAPRVSVAVASITARQSVDVPVARATVPPGPGCRSGRCRARRRRTHAVVAGEVVDLRLPDPRVADRVRRQEHDRRAPAAVDLPVQAETVGASSRHRTRRAIARAAPVRRSRHGLRLEDEVERRLGDAAEAA